MQENPNINVSAEIIGQDPENALNALGEASIAHISERNEMYKESLHLGELIDSDIEKQKELVAILEESFPSLPKLSLISQ